MGISFSQLFILLVLLGFLLIPFILTAFSTRAKGAGKLGWCILVFFTSWVGYGVFLVVTQVVRSGGERQT